MADPTAFLTLIRSDYKALLVGQALTAIQKESVVTPTGVPLTGSEYEQNMRS